MAKIQACITGVGGYLPDYVLTNQELSQMVDTTDEWIMSRIGIRERRMLKGEGLGSSEMGKRAIEELLRKTNTRPEEVDMLLCATVTPDMQFPATANILADKLGIKNGFGFDMNAGCSSFLYALVTASKFVESGTHKKVVVVGVDKMTSIVNYQDAFVPDGWRFVLSCHGGNGAQASAFHIPGGSAGVQGGGVAHGGCGR